MKWYLIVALFSVFLMANDVEHLNGHLHIFSGEISIQILYPFYLLFFKKRFLFLFLFWPRHMACGISVPAQGLNPGHDSESPES